jgi:hypothetical protein
MVRIKSDPTAALPINDSLCDEPEPSMEISPDKKTRQRKSTSAIVELNNQENIPDQVISLT